MSEVQISEHATQVSAAPEMRLSSAGAGRSAKKRQHAVNELMRQMRFDTRPGPDGRIEGPLRPCTVVNTNPLPLVVQGQLRITVPAPGTTEHHQLGLTHRGRRIVGHYCYIASPMVGQRKPDQEPIYYTTVIGHEQDSILPIDVPTSEARVFTPHSIACELLSQYNSPSMKLMGGVLVFDGDPHSLEPHNLARTDGHIFVPERTQLEGSFKYSYRLRRVLLEDELDAILETQRRYIEVVLQQAHTWFSDEDVTSRKMITDTHREWARYAKKMGYLQSLPDWVTAKLALASEVADLVSCRYCGKQQPKRGIYFCPSCRAPYDAYQAFKAGLAVPKVYLEMLEGEELAEVQETLKRRAAKFAAETDPNAEPAERPQADPEPAEQDENAPKSRNSRKKRTEE